ncbi:MAG: ABC transporter permease, partial [Candidatus Neomarinimicrobiota bacterium]|nr:ABC transporter permease [Candidatus Neomarinimicrobiota bacterium]
AHDGFLSVQGTKSYLQVSSEIGILAIGVALLMISGEFDLSIGSLIGFSSMSVTLLTVEANLSMPVASILTLIMVMFIGYCNGITVVKSGLPSFIITLGSLFMVRGVTIAVSKMVTGRTQLGGLEESKGYNIMSSLFSNSLTISETDFPISILWWVLFGILGYLLLKHTQIGNWIFATGASKESAKLMGIPVNRVKTSLFMLTAFCAWFIAITQVTTFGGADVLRGEQKEFIAIIAAVIGGTLLTGGYGSIIGAMIGALIFGIVKQGIIFAGVDADWFQVFMGVMLISAVLVNGVFRKKYAHR